MGMMVYSLLWVMQDLHHQPCRGSQKEGYAGSGFRTYGGTIRGSVAWIAW